MIATRPLLASFQRGQPRLAVGRPLGSLAAPARGRPGLAAERRFATTGVDSGSDCRPAIAPGTGVRTAACARAQIQNHLRERRPPEAARREYWSKVWRKPGRCRCPIRATGWQSHWPLAAARSASMSWTSIPFDRNDLAYSFGAGSWRIGTSRLATAVGWAVVESAFKSLGCQQPFRPGRFQLHLEGPAVACGSTGPGGQWAGRAQWWRRERAIVAVAERTQGRGKSGTRQGLAA